MLMARQLMRTPLNLAVVALALAAALAVPAIRHWREQPPPPPRPPEPLQSTWSPPDSVNAGSGGDYPFGLALAPNGRKLVYPAAQSGRITLWLEDLRTGETHALTGTDGAAAPFWSADGSRIGYFSADRLKAIDPSRGQISDLADVRSGRGGAWNSAGDIVFAPQADSGLMRRAPDGSITPFTTIDRAKGEIAHAWPAFVTDGAHVLFLVTASDASRAGVWIASLADPAARRRIAAADSQVIVSGETMFYLKDLALMAQPIDLTTFAASGQPRVAALRVGRGALGQIFATAAPDALIYGAPSAMLRQLQRVTREGAPAGWSSEPIDAWDLRIAPDGRRLVVTEIDRQFRTLDVVIRTPPQPAPTRLSLSTDVDESGVWSPDGLRIAWAAQRNKVMIRGAGAVLPEQTITTFETPVQVWDWSRDGRTLVIGRRDAKTGDDLWLQPPVEGEPARPYVTGAFNQTYGVISPDGRALAYASDESGQFDVYVDTFPAPGARIRVTTAGGTEPRWSHDGRELYFRRGSEMHAAVISGSEVRSLTRLFDAGAPIRAYDVSRDGRFVINVPARQEHAATVTLVANWRSASY